jgi:diguanylate cyclase (GGDEF)-like protein
MKGTGDDTANVDERSIRLFSWRTLRNGLLTPRAIVVGAVVIVSCMVALFAIVMFEARLDALARARDASRNVAVIAERDIERNFELYSLSLQAVVDGVNDPAVMAAPPKLRNDILYDRAATASYLGSIMVLDATGKVVVISVGGVPKDLNVADRPYFTVHRDNPNVGLYVSDPYRSRLRDDAQSIALSRRISRPDGSFGGVAVVAVELEYFRKLFAELELGPHGSVALIGRDGIMIMRHPFDEQVIGRDISHASTYRKFIEQTEGSFSDTSTIDGVRRFYYFRNLPNLPLILMVAEAEPDIYAAWYKRAIIIGSLMAVFAGGVVLLAFLLSAQLRRRMRAESELALLARTDSLTGLHNRRTFGETLDKEWRRARRSGTVFSLLFVDLDRFKAYNDTYGHQAGDDALAAVASCIGDHIRRPADSAARYGGEEFVVVLPGTSSEGAVFIAEKIRAAISDLAIEHAGSEFGRVTASIGAAAWTSESDGDMSAVIHAADEALYNAKAAGRNKVALSSAMAA